MKYLVVGDIHGDINFLEKISRMYADRHKIFVGDLVDSFDHTRGEQLRCVELSIELIESGSATFILGNHELSYLDRNARCSGWAGTMDSMLLAYKSKIWKHWIWYKYFPERKLLITHAGLDLWFWKNFELTFENLEAMLTSWSRMESYESPAQYVGKYRGGESPVGGFLWCDWNAEFTPIPGLRQIVGHTGLKDRKFVGEPDGIREREGNYNLDCLHRKYEILLFEDGTDVYEIKKIQ